MQFAAFPLGSVSATKMIVRSTCRSVLGAALLLTSGCSGGGPAITDPAADRPLDGEAARDSEASAADEPSQSSAGTAAGDLRVFVQVHAEVGDALHANEIPVTIDIEVAAGGEGVSGATVEAGAVGKVMAAVASRPGHYVVSQIGLAPWYEVSIESASGSLKNVRLRAPHLHAIHVEPSHPKLKDAEVRWTPNHENDVDDVGVSVAAENAGENQNELTFSARGLADVGALVLPESALAADASHEIAVRRAVSLELAAPRSVAIVEVVSKQRVERKGR